MAKIAIFAGHGGSDPGAVGNGLKEKDLTLAVSNKATAYLKSAGHTVINNRTTDIDSTIANKVQKANSSNVDAVVEIHFNAGGGTGTEVYYSISGGKGKELADAILDRITSLGYNSRGIKTKAQNGKDYFGIIRETKAPAILVECAFIDNVSDMKMYDADKIGKAVAEGVMAVFGGNASNGGQKPVQAQPDNTIPASDAGYSAGDKIRVKKTATRFATGEKMLDFVPGGTYYIREIGIGKVLVSPAITGAYTGWINTGDIERTTGSATAPSVPPKPASTIKVGSKVKVRAGAKTYDGKGLASFVYSTKYDVLEISGGRVVIGLGKAVTAAVKLADLILQ